jgi:MFS family permease
MTQQDSEQRVYAADTETAPTGAIPAEERTEDPTVVRTNRPLSQTSSVPSTDSTTIHSTRYARRQVLERYGGFYWGADFIGFVVAAFFTMLFLGIVGAIVGSVGYQLGQPLPKIGHAVSQTSQNLGIGALIGSLVAIFLAYLIGGYTAGRMARFSGPRNGVGVVIWTVIVAILLGIAGAALGSNFNVASQLHLKFDPQTVTAAGAISAVITLLDMILGATLGGMMGERYHRDIDRETGTLG